MAGGDRDNDDGMGSVRAVFVLYLLLIVAGLALYIVVGLSHH